MTLQCRQATGEGAHPLPEFGARKWEAAAENFPFQIQNFSSRSIEAGKISETSRLLNHISGTRIVWYPPNEHQKYVAKRK